jgi:hypothetical protein
MLCRTRDLPKRNNVAVVCCPVLAGDVHSTYRRGPLVAMDKERMNEQMK